MQCWNCYCYYSLNGKYCRRVLITHRCWDAGLFKQTEHRVEARAVEGASARHIKTCRCDAYSHGKCRVPLVCCTFLPAVAIVYFSFSLVWTCKIRGQIYSLKFRFTQTCKGNLTHASPISHNAQYRHVWESSVKPCVVISSGPEGKRSLTGRKWLHWLSILFLCLCYMDLPSPSHCPCGFKNADWAVKWCGLLYVCTYL